MVTRRSLRGELTETRLGTTCRMQVIALAFGILAGCRSPSAKQETAIPTAEGTPRVTGSERPLPATTCQLVRRQQSIDRRTLPSVTWGWWRGKKVMVDQHRDGVGATLLVRHDGGPTIARARIDQMRRPIVNLVSAGDVLWIAARPAQGFESVDGAAKKRRTVLLRIEHTAAKINTKKLVLPGLMYAMASHDGSLVLLRGQGGRFVRSRITKRMRSYRTVLPDDSFALPPILLTDATVLLLADRRVRTMSRTSGSMSKAVSIPAKATHGAATASHLWVATETAQGKAGLVSIDRASGSVKSVELPALWRATEDPLVTVFAEPRAAFARFRDSNGWQIWRIDGRPRFLARLDSTFNIVRGMRGEVWVDTLHPAPDSPSGIRWVIYEIACN